MKVGLDGSRLETKVVGGWTPRSDNAVLEDMAVIEVTGEDVAEADPVDEVVRVIEASVDDEESDIDELVAVTGPNSGVETAEVETTGVVDTAKAGPNEPKHLKWMKN